MNNVMQMANAAGHKKTTTREENLLLYKALLNNEPGARDSLILANMPLVTLKVTSFLSCRQLSHLRDELISVGMLALVRSVDNLRVSGEHLEPNPTGYLGNAIVTELMSFVDSESLMPIHRRTRKRAVVNGKPIVIPKQVQMDMELIPKPDPMLLVELRDEIDSCCESELESQIIQLRSEKRTDQEIADELHLPRSTVEAMRRSVYQRFLAKSGMKKRRTSKEVQ